MTDPMGVVKNWYPLGILCDGDESTGVLPAAGELATIEP